MVALHLSAVTVVTMSAPATAAAVEAQRTTRRPGSRSRARLRSSLSVAPASVSNSRTSRTPSMSWKASVWNSLCAPLPMSAMTRLSGRAMRRAASAEVAAVRSAVVSVSSDSSSG